jgi:hypothetical protein
MDPIRFPKLMAELYGLVTELELMFQRPFTPDGHMVGSIGEALAAHYYGLTQYRTSRSLRMASGRCPWRPCAASIALCTSLRESSVRANNSSKPTPLRGAA